MILVSEGYTLKRPYQGRRLICSVQFSVIRSNCACRTSFQVHVHMCTILNAHSLPHAFYDVCISIFLLAISNVTDFSKPEMQQLRRDAFDGHTIWTVPLNCIMCFHWILGMIDFCHRWVCYLDSRPTTLTSSLEHQGPSWAFAVRHMFDQSCLC